jgi:hypothetical protein
MFESKINRGKANGYAPLGSTGKVPLENLPPIQSTLNTGSFATTGSNTFTGVQTLSGTSGTGGAAFTIGQFANTSPNSFDVRVTGSSGAGVSVTSDSYSIFGVTDIPSVPPNNSSFFANEIVGYPFSDGPIAAIGISKNGTIQNDWIFNYDGKSFLPSDVTIGFSNLSTVTSGSLNITNGNINVSGSIFVSGNIYANNLTGSTFNTGSFATTGSNVFRGNQSISGSVNISSSLIVSSTIINSGNIAALNSDLIIDGGDIILSGSMYFGSGSSITENSSSIIITPAGAAAGQSLVVRPTAGTFNLTTDHPDGFTPGESITITTTNIVSNGQGTLNYEFSGASSQQLGIATIGTLEFGISDITKDLTWIIPSLSSMTTFTFTLVSGSGFGGVNGLPIDITVTLNGSAVSENNHIHLVSGDPTMVDIYLGDDDQYIKIEKNGGDVVIGTNTNTHHWIFDTSGSLSTPGSVIVGGSLIQQVNYTPLSSGSGGDTATHLDITKDIHILDITDSETNCHWYLPDGLYEGQVVRLALIGNGVQNPNNVYVWPNHLRNGLGSIRNNESWSPFWDNSGGSARSLATAVYVDGAWNIDNGFYNLD